MAKKKLILDYDYDFLLFGISCHVKDYKLCWAINQQLGINLTRDNEFQLPMGDGEEASVFPYYEFSDKVGHIKYIVVGNRGTHGYLLQEQRQADFFLIIEGYYESVDPAELIAKLKQVDVILTAYPLDPNQLKSKENLIFD